jgi:type IX secretion system PorP/SprF family membrane protein
MSLGVQGQSYIQNTMYNFNRLVYNPATAGTAGGVHMALLGRLQWTGIDGAPSLTTAAIHAPSQRLSGGLGGFIIGDKLGPLSTIGVNVAYAFHLAIGDDGASLNIGVQGGILQKALNANWRYDPSQGIDPILGQPFGNFNGSTLVPNLGAGLYFSLPNDRFYIGLSGQDLLEPSVEGMLLDPNIGEESNVPRSFYVMTGYKHEFSERVSLQPNIFVRTDGASFQFDINAILGIKPLVFGVSHRWKDSFSGMVGFNMSDRFFMGYAYDYTISGLNANSDLNSHEIILSYTIPSGEKFKPVEDNPLDKPPTGF